MFNGDHFSLPKVSVDKAFFERDNSILMLPLVAEVVPFNQHTRQYDADDVDLQLAARYGFETWDGEDFDGSELKRPTAPHVIAMLVDAADPLMVHLLEGSLDYTGKVSPARIYASPSLTEGAKSFIKQAYENSEVLRAYRARHGVQRIEVEFVDHFAKC